MKVPFLHTSTQRPGTSPAVTYLDVGWTCGGMAHSLFTAVRRLSEPKKRHQDCLMSTAQSLHGPWLRSVAPLWFIRECATPPYVHPTSGYITACDTLFPCKLTVEQVVYKIGNQYWQIFVISVTPHQCNLVLLCH